MTHQRGRSIELFFVDGSPDGMVTATIPFQWSGHVLVSRRTQLKEALDREETLRPGVYFLVGTKEGKPTLYIGETDELRTRMKQHAADKDWWETAILVSSSGEPLNKALVRYLEYQLYMRASSIRKVALDNSQSPTESTLSDAARAHMNHFLENIYLVLPALRFDFLTENTKSAAPPVVAKADPVVHFCFEVPKYKIRARAHIEDGVFVVEAGSLAHRRREGGSATYKALYQQLFDQGILEDDGAHAIFRQSYGFSSTSAASDIVAGWSTSGPRSWVVENTSQTYGEWEAERLRQPAAPAAS